MPPKYKTVDSVINRFGSHAESGAQVLEEGHINQLNKRCNLLEDLGIIAGPDKKIPSTGGIPRIFVYGKDASGADEIQDLETANCSFGSAAFWEQVQRGNVFAYPAGEKNPVQIRVVQRNGNDPAHTEVAYSKPIPPEQMPQPQTIPPRPNGWKRFMNIFGFYKREINARNAYERGLTQTRTQMQKMSETRAQGTGTELSDAEKRQAEVKEEKRIEENKKEYNSAEADLVEIDRRMGNMVSMMRPQPEHRNELNREKPESGRYGIYNDETFSNLTNFKDFDASKIDVNGKPLTDLEFSAVTFFAVQRPQVAIKTHPISQGYDPTISGILKNQGFTDQEREYAISSGYSNMYSIDMLMDKPRDNSGIFFKDGVDPSRKEVKEAFEAYAQKKPEKLATLLADCVNIASREAVALNGSPKMESYATYKTASTLLGLVERDPKLAALAQEKGMKPENLNALKGLKKLGQLHEDRLKAERDLKKAIYTGDTMTEEQKRECAMKIIRSRLAEKKITWENNGFSIKNIEDRKNQLMKDTINPPREVKQGNPQLRIDKLPQGKVWFDSAQSAAQKLHFYHAQVPPTLENMPAHMQTLEKIGQQICKDLDMGNMKPEQILENTTSYKLNKPFDAAMKGIKAEKDGPQLGTGEVQNAVEKPKEIEQSQGPVRV